MLYMETDSDDILAWREAQEEKRHDHQIQKAEVLVDLEQQRRVLDRLRAWHRRDEDRRTSPAKYLWSCIRSTRPTCPAEKELLALATYFFPPRAELTVTVCDFGAGRYEKSSVSLGRIDEYMLEKPGWATLRWIHVPVGSGTVCRYVEDTFIRHRKHSNSLPDHQQSKTMGTAFATVILSIKDHQYSQDQLDVFNMLSTFPELTIKLNELNLKNDGRSKLLFELARWAHRLDVSSRFWAIVRSDMPWQLGEESYSSRSAVDIQNYPPASRIEEQMLSRHPYYRGAVLVRDPLHCLHRDDGMLLTLSPPMGVHHLHSSMLEDIQMPPRAKDELNDDSALNNLRYKLTQLTTLGSESAEWFAVYLMSVVTIAPHSKLRRDMPEIRDAYQPIVRDLKSRQALRSSSVGTVELVREYVALMDEITHIHDACEQKHGFLHTLLLDCQEVEEHAGELGDIILRADWARETMTQRVQYSIRTLEESCDRLPRFVKDLRSSLDVLFQLKTIEQNDLAVLAESNNRAILAFTMVTIIFLPLSFFTSYFGMNLRGVADTDKTERYFWAVCGTTTFFVVSATIVFGFKERLYRWLWTSRQYSRAVNQRER
ncbi:MAG: hypothetical protein Q9179_004228 [Wetmoreana sp. 5 TL-2023]